MNFEHSFGWKGLSFFVKLTVLCLSIGVAGELAFLYASAHFSSSVPPAVAAQEASSTPALAAEVFSSSTPQRVINSLTIADAVPQTGKFIGADLVHMKLYLYQDGVATAEYPILTKGRPGTPYETPSGFYAVLTKEENHFNKGEQVYMPYSMQFYGNYFIHGWPYYTDGTPVASTYSGGCIRLSTEDAAKVYAFADKGTGIFVYDSKQSVPLSSLALDPVKVPSVSAAAYLVADIDTGDVLLEQDATTTRPIASITKLMTALVANETIMFDKKITVPPADLLHTQTEAQAANVQFPVGDLLYPLLMESNNAIATTLAKYYGTNGFVGWMNTAAHALDMASTSFADASGVSPEDVSTPDDLFRLAVYLTNKKPFIWNITRTPTKTLTASDGSTFTFNNFNEFSSSPNFVGGKVGRTGQALDTMMSVFTVPIDGTTRRVAIIVLKSDDYTADTTRLADWFTQSASRGAAMQGTACVSCATTDTYRKIQP